MVPPWMVTFYSRKARLKNIILRQRCLFLFGVVAFMVAVLLVVQALRPPVLWAVKINGEAVGWVEDRQALEEALSQIEREKAAQFGRDVQLATSLDFEQVAGGELQPSDPQELACRLAQVLAYTVPAVVILVDGQPVVALASEEEAREVLAEIQDQFRSREEGVILEELFIREAVEIAPRRVETSQLKDKEEALRILLRGTDEIITHRVQKGESLWSIARDYDLRVEDLRRANPDLKSDLLQIGQELNLVVPKPYLTVCTRETVTFTQAIPYPTRTVKEDALWVWERRIQQRGRAGSKEVTWEIIRENGREVERKLLAEKVLAEPVTQVVAIGTKLPVAQGTGELRWPMNRGSITSRYGYRRGRLHQGVDIAAPTGTPIYAADSGVVTMAQWYGAYGKTVVIDHGNGVSTLYGHCLEILVRVGSEVKKGQLIARVGDTGRSTGPHLHFEVRVNGQPRDPLRYFK